MTSTGFAGRQVIANGCRQVRQVIKAFTSRWNCIHVNFSIWIFSVNFWIQLNCKLFFRIYLIFFHENKMKTFLLKSRREARGETWLQTVDEPERILLQHAAANWIVKSLKWRYATFLPSDTCGLIELLISKRYTINGRVHSINCNWNIQVDWV